MKKTFALIAVAMVSMAGMFAAGVPDSIIAEGKLTVTDSVPAISGSDKTWLLPPGPFYQVAWENGIKVGDTVKAEGFERECPADFGIKNAVVLMPSRVWVNGKEINLSGIRNHMMGGGRFGRGMGMGFRDGIDGDGCGFRGERKGDRSEKR